MLKEDDYLRTGPTHQAKTFARRMALVALAACLIMMAVLVNRSGAADAARPLAADTPTLTELKLNACRAQMNSFVR